MDQIILESMLEPKTLDAWSQSLSFEISVPAPQPALGYCSQRYKNAFATRNLFFVF